MSTPPNSYRTEHLHHIAFTDAGSVQVGAHPETSPQGEARHDATVHPQTSEDADQVPGQAVEEEQHEDNVGYIPEGPPQTQR